MAAKDWITLGIAIWGAILGTGGFILSVLLARQEREKEKRKVVVYIRYLTFCVKR